MQINCTWNGTYVIRYFKYLNLGVFFIFDSYSKKIQRYCCSCRLIIFKGVFWNCCQRLSSECWYWYSWWVLLRPGPREEVLLTVIRTGHGNHLVIKQDFRVKFKLQRPSNCCSLNNVIKTCGTSPRLLNSQLPVYQC